MNLGFTKGFALAFPVSIAVLAACGGTADVGSDRSNVNNNGGGSAGTGNEAGGSAGVVNVPVTTGGGPGQAGASQGGAAGGGSSSICGGLHGDQCSADEWCDFGDNDYCGAADAAGVCKARPQACTKEYKPVCGCDGQMYGNACEANSAGTDATTSTSCFPSQDGGGGGKSCGGFAGAQCGTDEWCDFGDNDLCGAADATGVCQPRPQVCDTMYDPVCGCDGQMYGNACAANAAGTDASSDTSCIPTGGSCKGNADCRLVDDYCGGCNCLALAPGESAPTCSDPVQCLRQPCGGMTAACVSGSCVAQ